jgi:hypothetical protein
MSIEEEMFKQYGPLLSMGQLAKLLDRSAEGLRITLLRESDWTNQINETRLKQGRRVYFRTAKIAQILGGM